MKSTFRLSMDWLHTWSGLVFGWLLFAIFLTGTAAVFKNETTVWMTPEHGRQSDITRAIQAAESRLQTVAPGAISWAITLPDSREPATRIEWRLKGPERDQSGDLTALAGRETLDAGRGAAVQLRATQGGDFFYNFHHRLDQPSGIGWWFTGAAGIVMLVSLVSGIVIHRRIFKDFFTFRPHGNTRLSWLDAHTVLGVLVLPFHLMITYTGFAPMLITVMAPPIVANYAGDRTLKEVLADYPAVRTGFQNQRRFPVSATAPAGVPAQMLPLTDFVDRATQQWEGGAAQRITVSNPGDARAVVDVERHVSGQLAYQPERLSFDGTSGRLIGSATPKGPAWTTFSVMWGLHEARFADSVLRWVYFFLGLMSTAMIGTGLVFWTVKRVAKRHATAAVPFGHRLVERLNVGFITGLPIAMASLFWANRILPAEMIGRATLEIRVFYAVWAMCLVFAAMRPSKRAWSEGMAVAAFAYGAVPVINGFTTDRWLPVSMAQGDWIMASFDATMFAVALLFAGASWRLASHAESPARRESRVTAVPVVHGSGT